MAYQNSSELLSDVTNQTDNDPFACSSPITYLRFVALIIFIIMSLAANVFVVVVFYRNKALRTSVNYFIVSMVISDVIFSLTFVHPAVSGLLYKDNRWLLDGILGSALCKLMMYSFQVSRFVSLFSMVAMAADRFRGILFTFKPALINQTRRPLVITATWIVSMIIPVHLLYGVKLVPYDTKNYCVFQWDPPSYTTNVLRITYLLKFCTTAASAVILTVLYSKIIIFLYKENRTLHLQSEVIKTRAKRNRKITTMLVLVVVAFYAFWSPYAVASVKWIIKPGKILQCDGRSGIITHLVYPIVNPLIYFIFNGNYRRGFRELLCCRCFKNSQTVILPLKA